MDLFVANVDQETFALYRNQGNETFIDVARQHDIAKATRLLSGWGLKFSDFDNDGHLDLILSNGHPDDMIDSYSPQVRYKEPMLLFHNDGKRLNNISQTAGAVFQKDLSARGLAIGDFDNDELPDVLVGNNGGAPLLLHNNAGQGNHWLGVSLVWQGGEDRLAGDQMARPQQERRALDEPAHRPVHHHHRADAVGLGRLSCSHRPGRYICGRRAWRDRQGGK